MSKINPPPTKNRKLVTDGKSHKTKWLVLHIKCLFHKTASSISTSWQSLLHQSTLCRIQKYWKGKILFLLMKRKLPKKKKKKKNLPWRQILMRSMIFCVCVCVRVCWRGEGIERIEKRKQKKQPQDNKLCVKQKIIPFEGHFLWVAASGRLEAEIKHQRESPHLLARHHSALKCSGSREQSQSSWGCADPSKHSHIKSCPLNSRTWDCKGVVCKIVF